MKQLISTIRKINLKTWAIIIVVLLLIDTMAIFVSTLSIKNRFTRDIIRGLQAGWKLENSEQSLQIIDEPNNTDFISIEYDAIKKYKNVTFGSNKLNDIKNDYISALEGCQEIVERYNPEKEYNKFWDAFSGYYGKRIMAIYNLYQYNRSGFIGIKNDYQDSFNNLLLNGWALEKTGQISLVVNKDESGNGILTAELKNDSGFDLAFFEITVDMQDENGESLDVVSTAIENLRKKEKRRINIVLTNNNIKKYCIISETCAIMESK